MLFRSDYYSHKRSINQVSIVRQNLRGIRISTGLIAIFIVALFWSACSVKKNNVVSRNYHGMITHYNFYFNARERVKMGSQSLATSHEDKYDRVLSIFKYGDLNKAKSVFPDMDEAMKKVSIAIARNSMVLKGKKDNKLEERNKWIDDCYLQIGRAHV